MKVKLNTPITDIRCQEIKDENGEVVVLKAILVQALLRDDPDLKDSTVKYKRFVLANDIQNTKDIEKEFTLEEIVELKNLVNKSYGVLVYGKVTNILENKNT